MGLLDDAIREHLELKRRRGADPGTVAREEHDALGPVRRGDDAEHDNMDDRSSVPAHDQGAPVEPDALSTGGSTDSGSGGQETVEINMEAELAAEHDSDAHREAGLDAPATHAAHPASARVISDESLEWEAPDADEETHLRTEPFDEPGSPLEGDEEAQPIEDVLEETPDFLRETPEQERLWFEQRPPRDFDFDK